MRTWMCLGALALCALLPGCSGGGGGGSSGGGNSPPPAGSGQTSRYKIGGNVVGLRGSGLVLQIGQGETVAVQANGTFAFPTPLAKAAGYEVKVVAQPIGLVQLCSVSNGTGIVAGVDVTNIEVFCVTSTFHVGGTLSGLHGTGLKLYLQPYNGQLRLTTQIIAPSADGSFEFPTALEDGIAYQVLIGEQPATPRQVCVVANDAGTLHGSDINAPSVTCTTSTYTISGTVSGLRGQGLVLTNQGADSLAVSADGLFRFPTPLFDFTSFSVQVATQPTNLKQNCFVTNSAGFVTGSDVSNVMVNCTATQQLGSAGDDEARTAGIDTSQNLYVAGRTTGSLDGAPNAGGWDGFLLKFNPAGELRWKRQLRSPGDEAIEAIAMGNGEVYIAGSTSSSLDGSNAGSDDVFVAKYDRDGNVQWIRQLGTNGSDVAHGLSGSADGSVYIAGKTHGALDGSTAAGESDLFAAKLDASGTLLWLRQLGSPASDAAFDVAVDALGGAYVAGGTAGNLDGMTNTSGGEAGFIVKYDSMGNKQGTQLLCQVSCWLSQSPSARVQSRINSIAVGVSGESYVAGWMMDDASGTFGYKSTMDAMIEANGVRRWLQSSSHSSGPEEISNIVLADGGLYMVGNVANASTGRSAAFATRIYSHSLQTVFFSWISSPASVEALAVASDYLGNAYVVGRTFGSLDRNQHLGGSDIFIVRYNQVGQQQ